MKAGGRKHWKPGMEGFEEDHGQVNVLIHVWNKNKQISQSVYVKKLSTYTIGPDLSFSNC